MTTYALYVPSAIRPVDDLDMEVFPSREVAGWTLKQRVRTGRSRSFYLRDGNVRVGCTHPDKTWPVWDETGHFRVWLRKASDPVPGLLSRPDEEWLIKESGALERLPWTEDADDWLTLSRTGERALSRQPV